MESKFWPGWSLSVTGAVVVFAIFAAIAQAQDGASPAPAAGAAAEPPLYTVVDGNKVDEGTFNGWKTWRAMACERCHGANQQGLVGPSLNDDLKTMTKDEFVACVLAGRVEKGMPDFGGSDLVLNNIDNLYAYLKGRSDGAIAPGHLHKITN